MKKIVALTLALLILVFNVRLTMNTHFCGGHAVKKIFSVGSTHLDCGMANMDKKHNTPFSHEHSLTPEPCCKNQHQAFQLTDNIDIQSHSVEVRSNFCIALLLVCVKPLVAFQTNTNAYKEYSPPLLTKDIQTLVQSFLI